MVKISVVTPCYNDGRYLMEAVDSVTPLRKSGICEHIIIDDGSTDPDTLALYPKLQQLGLKVYFPGKVGLGEARNLGIGYSQAPYYLNLDADNRIRPHFPEVASRILDEHQEVGVVYGDAQFFGAENKISRPGPFDRIRMLRHNFIDTCSVIRREVWEETGGYDRLEMVWEDWNFWLGVLNTSWQFYYVREVLYDYRKRKEGSLNSDSITRGEEVERYIASKHGLTYRKAFLNVLHDLENNNHRWENERSGLQDLLDSTYKKLQEHRDIADHLTKRGNKWEEENLSLKNQLAKLNVKLEENAELIHELKNEIKDQIDENHLLRECLSEMRVRLDARERDLRDFRNSRSWKITAPARLLMDLFKR